MTASKKALTPKQLETLLATLQTRFEQHPRRHKDLAWPKVAARLDSAAPGKLWSLHQMEATGGEPDVIAHDRKTGEYLFVDCSPESPKGRVSVCYDHEGWLSRKEHRPKTNAVDLAAEMGVDILTEDQYRHLQTLGEFDQKTSTWILTPAAIRDLGGALFCDRRYGQVFTYHNGAQSYYSARAFRAALRV